MLFEIVEILISTLQSREHGHDQQARRLDTSLIHWIALALLLPEQCQLATHGVQEILGRRVARMEWRDFI